MRVELAAGVAAGDVDLCEVADTRDLDVVGRAHEVHALQRAVRDRTCAASGLGAPRDLVLLRVACAHDRMSSASKTNKNGKDLPIVPPFGGAQRQKSSASLIHAVWQLLL
jgi:hypothetical protein